MKREYLLTSESVSEGHPDKMADQISDAILDVFLANDMFARVACETLITKGLVVVAGEIASYCHPSIPDVVRWTIKNIGYTDPAYGFDYQTCGIITPISKQSPEISKAIKPENGEIRAGDQVTVFGYATNETPELMPLGIMLAHGLVRKQAQLRRRGGMEWLRPDAKSQITVRYVGAQPVSVEKVVFSTQHSPDVTYEELKQAVVSEIIKEVIPKELRAAHIRYLVNPGGSFTIGGPAADTGLTGRKIMVDTYGPGFPHGGGAFSGKDPTKLDRSAAYMARYIAKNIVAGGLAERCTVQLSYAMVRVDPVSFIVDLHGTGKVDEQKLMEAVRQIFKLTPEGIISMLYLHYPIYRKTAVYGHFGREGLEFTWEMTDQAGKLASYFGIPQDTLRGHETSAEIFLRRLGGININWNELRQFDTDWEEYLVKEITARSNSNFEVDFKKFLKSKYAQNRVALLDSFIYHQFIRHNIHVPIFEILKKEHKFVAPPSKKECLRLLKYKSDEYVCVTLDARLTNPQEIQNEISDILDYSLKVDDKSGFRCVPNYSPPPEPTNPGQMYLAVVHHATKYITGTNHPYSHITVHRIDDVTKTSKLVARFEDGEELTISDSS